MSARILVDGREFVAGRRTGIGRFLEGLLDAAGRLRPEWRFTVAMRKDCALPGSLRGRVEVLYLPHAPELFWPRLARGFDLFLSPYPKLPWRRLPCPAIHTVHDVLYLTHPAYRGNRLRVLAGRARLRRALRQASLTWFDSRASRTACEALARAPHGLVRFPAIDARFTPGEEDVPAGPPYFLFVGNGLPHKNLDVLLDAIRGVAARLVCVGVHEAAPFLARLDAETAGRVTFQGSVTDDELVGLYRGAVALLLPSTAEGFGYPPLEAMACGTPAVVSDIPVLRETTGDAAMSCPPHDAPAWREAMRAMLDADERARWRELGLAWVAGMRAPEGWRAHIEDMEALMDAGGAA